MSKDKNIDIVANAEDLDFEDLSAEEAKEISEKMLKETEKIKESIFYPTEPIKPPNYIELKEPESGVESYFKKRVREMVNERKLERPDFIEYLKGDNEQARKMINTYSKKKDFKIEEFITWIGFLNYNIKIIRDPDPLERGELQQTEGDKRIVEFENNKKFVPIKQILVDLINKEQITISNIKYYFNNKPTDAYNIIDRFKKNVTMTTDTFTLWLTLIGHTIILEPRGEK